MAEGLHSGWETAGVVFVVDDLAAWLIGLLADAGRNKLTTLVLGDAQERALQQAASAAVQDTAGELSPSDSQRAGQIAMVISEVFRAPVPDAPLAGVATLAEGLQAGIAGQLAVLDDVGLTGTGQSSAEVLGMPGTVLADRLTGHLVREIMLRGSRGGPLTPLAGQLNHDLTHLQVQRVEAQGQRVESILTQLAGEVRATLARPGSGAVASGRPLDEVNDPFALEVHQPVQPEDPQPGLPALPAYVPREHDTALGLVVRAAAEGSSGIAVLVGGSSTGKTRACWEALALLRDQKPEWRLWHPIDPTRPEAALRELPAIGSRTVVWLNEAQFYLDVADGGLGERVAAGLRELLRDPARAPVLVLATLWPQFWDGLTARAHCQARELLDGHDIKVPAAFTAAQLQQLSEAGDARLAQAAAAAQDGQVIQFLAGAPELLARYRHAPPTAAALIHAAMDARRLGMGVGLPQAFLEAAASEYLTDAEWDALGEDWLDQALAHTADPCKGVRGPLTRIRPRPARSRTTWPGPADSGEQLADAQASIAGGPLYRLADYLDQHGRQHRNGQFPPAGFWAAVAGHAFPDDQATLGDAAEDRGLYRIAAQLHKNAAACGNRHAVFRFSATKHYLRDDARPRLWAAAHVPLNDPDAVAELLSSLQTAGAHDQVTALLRRDPAAHAPLDNPWAVAELLSSLQRAGAHDQVTALADRATAHVPIDDANYVARLLDGLQEAGAHDQVTALLRRDPAAQVSLDKPGGVSELLSSLQTAGAHDQITTLLRRDAVAHVVTWLLDSRITAAGTNWKVTELQGRDPAAHVTLDELDVLVGRLPKRGAGSWTRARVSRGAAAYRPSRDLPLDDPGAVARLLDSLLNPPSLWGEDDFPAAGAQDQVTALLRRDPATQVSLDNPGAVARLLSSLQKAGAQDQVTALLRRDPAAHAPLDNPGAVADLLDSLRKVGAQDQVTALLRRDPAPHVPLRAWFDISGLDRLFDSLRAAGAQDQVTALASRAVAHVPIDDANYTAWLLDSLQKAGAQDQVTVLLRRDPAAHVSLRNRYDLDRLLDSLQKAGAQDQVTMLASRLPGAGLFELFREHEDRQDRFRFGREADGSPAGPWGWKDLD